MIARLLVILALILPSTAFAFDATAIGQTMVRDWQGWMQKYGVSEGAIIVSHNGVVIAEHGIKRTVDDPAKLASLSKAVTAICALTAVKEAGKYPVLNLSDAIPEALATHPPRDERFGAISVAQLITHTSGITSRYHSTELEKLRTFGLENKLWQFSKLAAEGLSGQPGRVAHHYSNANYLILGLVIEELTGEDYVPYCQRMVLAPLGITTATLNETWTVMSSWGGWEMSARDFLTFVQAFYAGDYAPDKAGGFFLPAAALERGRMYGAGMVFRKGGAGTTAWHLGSWRWKGRINDRFGAYVALYDNGISVVTNYAHDGYDDPMRSDLDTLLWRAAHPNQ